MHAKGHHSTSAFLLFGPVMGFFPVANLHALILGLKLLWQQGCSLVPFAQPVH